VGQFTEREVVSSLMQTVWSIYCHG